MSFERKPGVRCTYTCLVPDCQNKTDPKWPFCRACYAAMPKRRRRSLRRMIGMPSVSWRMVSEVIWHLAAMRLAKALRDKQQIIERYRELDFQYSICMSYTKRFSIRCRDLETILEKAGITYPPATGGGL